MNTSEHLSRRRLLTAAGTVGCGVLAGCSESDTEPKSTLKGEVLNISLGAHFKRESMPNDHQLLWILLSTEYGEFKVFPKVKEATGLSEDDVTPDTTITDLPMSKIYGEFDIVQTFFHVVLHNQTTDEINGRQPLEAPDSGYSYNAPPEYFGHIDVDSTYRFRVAKPGDYYPINYEGRIVDILERIEPATATEPE